MDDSTTTVTVGLDVHARSIRLAVVRADELLEERTLAYDEERSSGGCVAGPPRRHEPAAAAKAEARTGSKGQRQQRAAPIRRGTTSLLASSCMPMAPSRRRVSGLPQVVHLRSRRLSRCALGW